MVPPASMDVTVGESIVLTCQVTHDPSLDITFTWRFNGRPVNFDRDGDHFERVGGVSTDAGPPGRAGEKGAAGLCSRCPSSSLPGSPGSPSQLPERLSDSVSESRIRMRNQVLQIKVFSGLKNTVTAPLKLGVVSVMWPSVQLSAGAHTHTHAHAAHLSEGAHAHAAHLSEGVHTRTHSHTQTQHSCQRARAHAHTGTCSPCALTASLSGWAPPARSVVSGPEKGRDSKGRRTVGPVRRRCAPRSVPASLPPSSPVDRPWSVSSVVPGDKWWCAVLEPREDAQGATVSRGLASWQGGLVGDNGTELSVTGGRRDARDNHSEVSPHPSEGPPSLSQQTGAGAGVERGDAACPAVGTQAGAAAVKSSVAGPQKPKGTCLVTRRPQCWEGTQRNREHSSKEHQPSCRPQAGLCGTSAGPLEEPCRALCLGQADSHPGSGLQRPQRRAFPDAGPQGGSKPRSAQRAKARACPKKPVGLSWGSPCVSHVPPAGAAKEPRDPEQPGPRSGSVCPGPGGVLGAQGGSPAAGGRGSRPRRSRGRAVQDAHTGPGALCGTATGSAR